MKTPTIYKLIIALLLTLSSADAMAQSSTVVVECPSFQLSNDDGRGYLKAQQPSCRFFSSQIVTSTVFDSNVIVLANPASITLVKGQQGAVAGVSILTSSISVTTPAGVVRYFTLSEDRNPAGTVDNHDTWPVVMNLPAGTAIQYHAMVAVGVAGACGGGCLFNGMWELMGAVP